MDQAIYNALELFSRITRTPKEKLVLRNHPQMYEPEKKTVTMVTYQSCNTTVDWLAA